MRVGHLRLSLNQHMSIHLQALRIAAGNLPKSVLQHPSLGRHRLINSCKGVSAAKAQIVSQGYDEGLEG